MATKTYIIGHGFVGKAVDYAFPDLEEKIIIDPKNGTSLEDIDLSGDGSNVFFVCLPTPMGADGKIDSSILTNCVEYLRNNAPVNDLIIIKSTVTPDIIEELGRGVLGDCVVYNPEFLREATAVADIVSPSMHIFGGQRHATERAERFFSDHSICASAPVYHMSLSDASFVKYGINSFLATKVLWFNQFADVIKENGGNFGQVTRAMGTDERIGSSHMSAPGPDGKRGFGGACFPKDTSAFSNYADGFTVLKEVIERNNEYRKVYEKDDREKEQNISY